MHKHKHSFKYDKDNKSEDVPDGSYAVFLLLFIHLIYWWIEYSSALNASLRRYSIFSYELLSPDLYCHFSNTMASFHGKGTIVWALCLLIRLVPSAVLFLLGIGRSNYILILFMNISMIIYYKWYLIYNLIYNYANPHMYQLFKVFEGCFSNSYYWDFEISEHCTNSIKI
jgi:hypothetical protein